MPIRTRTIGHNASPQLSHHLPAEQFTITCSMHIITRIISNARVCFRAQTTPRTAKCGGLWNRTRRCLSTLMMRGWREWGTVTVDSPSSSIPPGTNTSITDSPVRELTVYSLLKQCQTLLNCLSYLKNRVDKWHQGRRHIGVLFAFKRLAQPRLCEKCEEATLIMGHSTGVWTHDLIVVNANG